MIKLNPLTGNFDDVGFPARTLTGTSNQVTVTNGDGVSGNPTLSLPQDIHTGASPTFAGATLNGSASLISSRAGGDDDGIGTDSTSRLNLYAYQRAHTNSFGENIRHYMMYKDAKSMDTWYFPDGGYDGSRLPVGTFKPVVWTGAHWEADDHGSLHKHWSVETPDSTGAIQTRFEIRFGDTTNDSAIAGLNKTLIATNLADFTVRNSNNQKFILSASDADGSDRVILFSKDAEGLDADRIWKIKTEGGATADLGIVRYNSSGVLQDQPFTIARSSGQITIGGSSGTSSGLVINRNGGTTLAVNQTGAGGTLINAVGADTSSQAFGTRVSGNASGRYALYTDGLMEWGSGSAARDTNLYRGAANILKTDDSLTVGANLYPVTDSASTLGTPLLYWSNTYTDKIIFNSTATIDGGTAGVANLSGKLQVNSVQAIYVPDQTNFAGGMFLGNGGGSLSHASGDEGQFNTGVGVDALLSVTTGNYNTAIGRALRSNTTGANNASIGAFSLGANTTGGGNMAIGTYALGTNVDGYNNIAIGASALYNSKGYYNTAIGASAGFTKPSGDGCVFIGYRSGYYETGSNKLFIDNTQRASEADGRAKALVYGVFAATTAAQTLTVNGVLNTSENIQVDGTQVVSNRVVDARCDDAINSGDATTDGVIDALRDAMIAHGLIAAA